MWQKITIFEQCENTAYFNCRKKYDEQGSIAIEGSAKWRE
jgi:hypothetical protein